MTTTAKFDDHVNKAVFIRCHWRLGSAGSAAYCKIASLRSPLNRSFAYHCRVANAPKCAQFFNYFFESTPSQVLFPASSFLFSMRSSNFVDKSSISCVCVLLLLIGSALWTTALFSTRISCNRLTHFVRRKGICQIASCFFLFCRWRCIRRKDVCQNLSCFFSRASIIISSRCWCLADSLKIPVSLEVSKGSADSMTSDRRHRFFRRDCNIMSHLVRDPSVVFALGFVKHRANVMWIFSLNLFLLFFNDLL